MTTDEESGQLKRYQNKVEELRAENARLLSELRRYAEAEKPAPLESPPPPGNAVAAAAPPAPTATGQPIIAGQSNSAADTTYLDSSGSSGAMYVIGTARGVTGVGQSSPGLFGYSYNADAVVGFAVPPNGQSGVRGQSNGIGVYGESTGSSIGVLGRSAAGYGTYGYSQDGPGSVGVSTNGLGAVAFSQQREALNAFSVNGDGVRASTSSGSAAAVFAENASGTAGGVGVAALGQAGVGVYASGEQAAIQLGRAQTPGPPTTGFHIAGELVLDANADLYLCKTNGTPGIWKLLG